MKNFNVFNEKNYCALIIGMNYYNSKEISNLDKAVKDANDFYDFLTDLGGYKKENVALLLNDEVTKKHIDSVINGLKEKINDETTFVLFVSGHGGSIESKYVLPLYNFSSKDKDTFYSEEEFVKLFDKIEVSKLVFLLDSCYAGIMAKEKGLAKDMSENLLERILKNTPINKSRIIIASSLPEQSSWESEYFNNGIFTYCLLKALKGACQTQKGNNIFVLDLLKYLIRNVSNTANKYGIQQNCCVKTSVLYQDFAICQTSGEMDYNTQLPNRFINAVVDLEEDQNTLIKKFASCLNDRKIDSKFAYWGEDVTKKYIELINTEEYILPNMTKKLLSENIDDIVERLSIQNKAIRVISLGIGDGYKDAIILNKLFESTKSSIDYWIIEISYEMIKIGLNNVRQQLKSENRQRLVPTLFQTDFLDIGILKELITDDKANIFLLLGNFPEDILLSKIYNVMKEGDYFLIDNQVKGEAKITNKEKKELEIMYNTAKYREYIYTILKNAKIDEKDGDIVTRIEPYSNANVAQLRDSNCVSVVQEFIFKTNKEINIGGKRVSFIKGSIIPVIYSRKYSKKALRELLNYYFSIVVEPYVLNNKYALILMKKENR